MTEHDIVVRVKCDSPNPKIAAKLLEDVLDNVDWYSWGLEDVEVQK